MRTLIVGAGVAGLTLAARLTQQGRPPTVVERAAAEAAGYALALYPLGACVLHGLGRYDDLLARGLVLERYRLADHAGRPLRDVEMSLLTGRIGPTVMVARRGLIELLETASVSAGIRRGVEVSALEQTPGGVEVAFSDGNAGRFDAVIGCDGLGSAIRDLVFGPQPAFNTGWILRTWWAAPGRLPGPVAREWWGRGWFFGAYPAPGAVMCAAGAPAPVMAGLGADGLGGLLGELARAVPEVASALGEVGESYPWAMRDVRSRSWADGRVALCGDAAAGFLPSAGVGASAAMRAAAALADELSRAGPATVPLALRLYELRCRAVVERAQSESRGLARLMLLSRPALCRARDEIARRYPARLALAGIMNAARTPF